MDGPDSRPEGPETEWKERVPRAERLARTLAAFANGGGGTLWIGVRDDGARCGVDDELRDRRRLGRASALVDPPVRLDVRRHAQGDVLLLEVRVRAAAQTPVAVVQPDGRRVVYVRDAASTRPAGTAALRALERPPASKPRIGAQERRLLGLLAQGDGLTLSALASAARMGQRTARRLLIPLLRAGLVHERDGRRFALTPPGHRRLR
jgi:DNA-binding transcriptional ArsR family regulator